MKDLKGSEAEIYYVSRASCLNCRGQVQNENVRVLIEKARKNTKNTKYKVFLSFVVSFLSCHYVFCYLMTL